MDAPTGQIMKIVATFAGAAIVLVTAAAVGQGSNTGEPRGELLYSTYCIGCHTTQIHWREKRLATDWTGLKFQVRRWLANTGVAYDDDDVVAVAMHLNRLYYLFPTPDTEQRGDANGWGGRMAGEGTTRTTPGAR
jgi:hypothetical protein